MGVMGRYITISAAMWALLAPILCLGGVLVHHCDCNTELACSHEGECPTDPCRVLVARSSASRFAQPLVEANTPAPQLALTTLTQLTVLRAHQFKDHAGQDPNIKRIPFPQSDAPLLI